MSFSNQFGVSWACLKHLIFSSSIVEGLQVSLWIYHIGSYHVMLFSLHRKVRYFNIYKIIRSALHRWSLSTKYSYLTYIALVLLTVCWVSTSTFVHLKYAIWSFEIRFVIFLITIIKQCVLGMYKLPLLEKRYCCYPNALDLHKPQLTWKFKPWSMQCKFVFTR